MLLPLQTVILQNITHTQGPPEADRETTASLTIGVTLCNVQRLADLDKQCTHIPL